MKKTRETALLFATLCLISGLIYGLHFLIFRDAHHILLYLVGDIAFLPLEVLLVSLIFDKLLEEREKKHSLQKLNMIKGVFFSEVGNRLLELLVDSDAELYQLQERLLFNSDWTNKDFRRALLFIDQQTLRVETPDFSQLKQFLQTKRDSLLRIIENPILLEHEQFSELMITIFHLEEELSNRLNVSSISANDGDHIKNDISRVYKILLKAWLAYIQHLQTDYPYLFSFAVRTNLFDQQAKAEID